MPVAGMTNQILLSKSDKFIEPITQNEYRMYLQVMLLVDTLKSQFRDDPGYLQSIRNSMVGNLLPLEIRFTPPAISVETRKIRGKGNVETKYGGWATYGNAEMSFHNWVHLDTFRFFYTWASLAGGIFLTHQDDVISNPNPLHALPVPSYYPVSLPLSSIYPGGLNHYKVRGVAVSYGTPDAESGGEMEINRWLVEGMFPATVSVDQHAHDADREMVNTTVSFSADLCLPVRPPPFAFAPQVATRW